MTTPSEAREGEQKRGIRRNLDRISPANRADVERLVLMRQNEDLSSGANYNFTLALLKADQAIEGKAFRACGPDDLLRIATHIRQTPSKQTGRPVSSKTAHLHMMLVRHYFKEMLGVDHLPQDLDRASRVRKPKHVVVGQVISEKQFQKMLAVAAELDPATSTLPYAARAVAILWVLWVTGFRAGELLSLNVGDIEFEGATCAWIRLREGRRGNRLKTGPRSIYTAEGVGALRAWLGAHPRGTDPRAPLFNGVRNRTGLVGLAYADLNKLVTEIAEQAGINAELASEERLTSHDYRHTCATRKAAQGWNEARLRQWFGWSPTSYMPAYYVHFNLELMREQVRKDANVDKTGQPLPAPPAMPDLDGHALLRALLRGLAQPGTEPKT